MKTSVLARLSAFGLALMLLSGCGSPIAPVPIATPPPGSTPVADVAQLKGTWIGQTVNFDGKPNIFYLRFTNANTCSFLCYSDFDGSFWLSKSTAQITKTTTGETLLTFGPMQTVSGSGTLGMRSDFYKAGALWIDDGRLYLGQQGFLGASGFGRAPSLDGVDLIQFAARHKTQVDDVTTVPTTYATTQGAIVGSATPSNTSPNSPQAVANAVNTAVQAVAPDSDAAEAFAAGYNGGYAAVSGAKSGMSTGQAALTGINQAAQTYTGTTQATGAASNGSAASQGGNWCVWSNGVSASDNTVGRPGPWSDNRNMTRSEAEMMAREKNAENACLRQQGVQVTGDYWAAPSP